MKDIINSIKVHLHEKTTSPLFGAFSLSWIAWNYKFIFVLLSDLRITEKFEYIETTLYPNIFNNILLGFIYPFITAVIIIFLYPYPAEKIFSYWKIKQKKMNELRQKIEGETLLSIDDSLKIRVEIDELEYKHYEALEAKDKKIQLVQENKVIEVNAIQDKLEQEVELKNQEIKHLNESLQLDSENSLQQLNTASSESSALEREIKELKTKVSAVNNEKSELKKQIITLSKNIVAASKNSKPNKTKLDLVNYKRNHNYYIAILKFLHKNGESSEKAIIKSFDETVDTSKTRSVLKELRKASYIKSTMLVSKQFNVHELTSKGSEFLATQINMKTKKT